VGHAHDFPASTFPMSLTLFLRSTHSQAKSHRDGCGGCYVRFRIASCSKNCFVYNHALYLCRLIRVAKTDFNNVNSVASVVKVASVAQSFLLLQMPLIHTLLL
jgi:hypothetical protein